MDDHLLDHGIRGICRRPSPSALVGICLSGCQEGAISEIVAWREGNRVVGSEDLMIALFSAFASFSAFGAAIGGFLATGGGIQTAIYRWKAHGLEEVDQKVNKGKLVGETRIRRAKRFAKLRPLWFWVVAVLIGLVALASGLGLFSSFWWLYTGTGWAIKGTVYLFEFVAVSLTLVTVLAVGIAASGAATDAKESGSKQQES